MADIHALEVQDILDQYNVFYDPVCSFCDNGGVLVACEGRCRRSFHATIEHGAEMICGSLGFSVQELAALGNMPFICWNCQCRQHQCFVCGRLGPSLEGAAAEVFQCAFGTCSYFYHPQCVSKWLQFKIGEQAKFLAKEISSGKPFICPLHLCYACKQLETRPTDDLRLMFAVCRRCPRAYHRKCLPKSIALEATEDEPIIRAWEGLLPHKILMYCRDHEIIEELGTPIRNHIKFPN